MTRTPLTAALVAGLLGWSVGPTATAQENSGVSPQTAKINELIAKGWASAGITKPAGKATDLEFMRRAFIDLIGRIPTPEEIIDFEADKTSNKRAKLINRLLNNPLYEVRNGGRVLNTIPGLKLSTRTLDNGKTVVGIDYNDAYANHFAELWTTWLLTRSNTHPFYREQLKNWLINQFGRSRDYPEGKPWNLIVRDLIGASGTGNDDGKGRANGAVIFIARHLGDPIFNDEARKAGDREDLGKNGKYDAIPITSRVTRLFLGIQCQCTQCHNHPFVKEYVQEDFWGVNAFFRQTDRSSTTNPRDLQKDINPPQITVTDNPSWNVAPITGESGRGMVTFERRDGRKGATPPMMLRDIAQFQNGDKFSGKSLLDGVIPPKYQGMTRRQILGLWITEHDNFSRAFVNRMWGHLFGRGLNKEPAVDDFSSNNEVVHPELLDYLAKEFEKYNYDPKKLLEWICTSDVYNLSHVANKEYAANKYDPYFARMPLKAMSPEVMLDSLFVATRAEARHRDPEAYNRLKTRWNEKLVQNFGDDEGNEVNFNGTVIQALLLMNGQEINNEIGVRGGRAQESSGVVAEILKRPNITPLAVYNELFLLTVSRRPTATEIARLEEVRLGKAWVSLGTTPTPKTAPKGVPPKKGPPPPAAIPVPGAAPNDLAFYQDVFWALLNSSEFILNH
jgi:hypothetical protein